MPVLSVIVPFHNVGKYLGPCLDSLTAQRFRDFEVICVDDGSRDDGAAVAAARAAADGRIRLIRQANLGVGRARNAAYGRRAAATWPSSTATTWCHAAAFQRLVASLESTGSDLACGNVMRLHRNLLIPSWAHKEAFAEPATRTHITRHPLLIRDRMLWNKVYRRSFWDALGLSFPDRMYEDQPVAIAAHVGAGAVDVLHKVVYHWRQRDEPGASITQRRLEPDNLRDRLLSVLETAALLDARARGLRPEFDRDTLEIDMAVAVEAIAGLGATAGDDLVDLVVRYLDGVRPDALTSLPFALRVLVRLLHQRRLEEVAHVFAQARDGLLQPPLSPAGLLRKRWYGRHPALPGSLSEVSEELSPTGRLVELEWRGGVLNGVGRVSVGRFDVSALGRVRVSVWLEERRTGERVPLSEESASPAWESAELPDGGCAPEHAYPFRFAFDPAAMTSAQLARLGHWDLWVGLRRPGLRVEGKVRGDRRLPPVTPPPRRRAGVWLVPALAVKGAWGLRLRRAGALVRQCQVDGGDLVFSGELTDPGDGEPVIRLVRRSDGEEMYFPVDAGGARLPRPGAARRHRRVRRRGVVLGGRHRPGHGRSGRWSRTQDRPTVRCRGRRFLVDRGDDGCLLLAER